MSIVVGGYDGPRLSVDRRGMDHFELRKARDIAIVQLREGLYPYRRPHTWREIGPKVCVSYVAAWKRYNKAIRDQIKEEIRRGYLG